jgi:phosphoglycolate phosphatase
MRNLIFDWSGTLVDDLFPVVRATNGIFAHYGRETMTRSEFLARFRLPFVEFYQEHLPEARMEEVEPLYVEHFGKPDEGVTVLAHAREFLDYCKATGRRMFVLSSTKRAHFDAQAESLGITDYFEEIYAEVWDKKHKIGAILADHGLLPEETAFIGDMVHDIDTARHGGITSVAVLTGYDDALKLAAAGPDVTVRDLGELRKVLEGGREEAGEERIEIRRQRVPVRVGVPDEERAVEQEVEISVTMTPARRFAGAGDSLERTVDYFAVSERVRAVAREKERKLIETLADDIAAMVRAEFAVARVEVEVRKFILPDTECVAVRMAR